jgi:hypothetical protein
MEQVYRQKYDGKSDENMTTFFSYNINLFWLGFQILQFFGAIYLGLRASD